MEDEMPLEGRYYDFTFDEARSLAAWRPSARLMVEYHDTLEGLHRDLQGLLFELSNVKGNWEHKDRVLPKLVHEIVHHWNGTRKKLEKIMEQYLAEENSGWRDYEITHYKVEHARRYNLVMYLFTQLKDTFKVQDSRYFNGDTAWKPSEKLSHVLLKKFLKRFGIRVENSFTYLLSFIKDRIKSHHACKIFTAFASKHLDEHAPAIVKNVEQYFRPARGYNGAKRHYDELLIPAWGNDEYKIGLCPVLTDIPGKGSQAFFFGDPEKFTSELPISEFRVIVLDTIRGTFHVHFNYHMDFSREKSFTEWFAELGELNWFKKWLGSESVVAAIANLLSNGLCKKVQRVQEDPDKLVVARTEAIAGIEKRYNLLKQWYGPAFPSAMLFFEKMKAQIQEHSWLKDEEKPIYTSLITPVKEGGQVA